MPSLQIVTAEGERRSLDLSGYSLTIGRARNNDLCLFEDRKVSRHHARLLRQGSDWLVEDLGSSNGTEVERAGQRSAVTGQAPLKDGDVVVIGSTRIGLSLQPSAVPSAPEETMILPARPVGEEAGTVLAPALRASAEVEEAGGAADLWRREAFGQRPPRAPRGQNGGESGVAAPTPPTPSGAGGRDNQAASQELFLLRLRYREGRLLELGSNTPFLLDDPGTAYIIFSGKVDIFVVSVRDGEAAGPRRHLLRVESGQTFFGVGVGAGAQQLGLLAVGVEGTRALKIDRNRLREVAVTGGRGVEAAALLDGWIGALSEALAKELPPKDCELLDPGVQLELKDRAARARRGVVWVRCLDGAAAFLGRDELVLTAGAGTLPLSRQTWLQATGTANLEVIDSAQLTTEEPGWPALDVFHELVLRLVGDELQRTAGLERELRERKATTDRRVLQGGLADLASVLAGPGLKPPPEGVDADDVLYAACRLVGEAQGIDMRPPPPRRTALEGVDRLSEIARVSRVRTRDVSLTAGWWKSDNGPLLGYLASDGTPVPLIPRSPGSYDWVNPATGKREPVNAAAAAAISRNATAFYRSFSHNVVLTKELLKFGLQGCRRDLWLILVVGLASGALAILVPLITNIVFDTVIPNSDKTKLVQITAALLVSALAITLFDLTRGVAVLRVEAKMDASIQSSIWDRLLALPAPFFRRFETGDLSTRALGINYIRQVMSGVIVASILGVFFSVFSIAVLFYYSVTLALIAVVMVLVIFLVTGLLSYLQIRQQKPLFEVQGRLSSLVLELITGVSKLRVTGAEGRAFAIWSRHFALQRRLAFRSRTTSNMQAIFDAMVSPLTLLVLIVVVAETLKPTLTSGSFLGFNAAFAQFLAAMAGMTASFPFVLSALPVFERLSPILKEQPEADPAKSDPGELTGEIEVNHVSFRYDADGPLVLNDFSLKVRAGEFVAIVGPSGAGKSSLFRVLLAFERLDAGSVYYDGKELAGLDVRAVRRQTGVVLQNGKLMSGSILSNILGASGRGLNEAWEAARMAGLDEDIQRLPMGMYTMISEGGSNFSGGQRQRLMIARAVVSKPRILLFDEATSALDNKTQELVSKNLEKLQATRIVIAHRLSTILNVDRIHVVVAGKVVQSGTYQELINQPGPFAGLVRRQLA